MDMPLNVATSSHYFIALVETNLTPEIGTLELSLNGYRPSV